MGYVHRWRGPFRGETTAGWGAVARSPDGRLYVMFGPVVTPEAYLAYGGARLHTNNTAELSSKIKALSFLGPAGPVARGSQASIFMTQNVLLTYVRE